MTKEEKRELEEKLEKVRIDPKDLKLSYETAIKLSRGKREILEELDSDKA